MFYEETLAVENPPTMTDAEFFRFCRDNADLRIERDKHKNIIIMPPTGFETGRRNTKLTSKLDQWSERHPGGEVGDSSTGYSFPNGSVRSPDASWISHERLAETTPDDREKFVHAVPEFVVEIRSNSDSPRLLREKMEEYIANGVLLAWYIDRVQQFVEIYRANGEVEKLPGLDRKLSGEDVLPDFEFDLTLFK